MSRVFEEKGYRVSEIRNHSYEELDLPMRYRISRADIGQTVFEGSEREIYDWIANAPSILQD